jgi:hypothetical protein
MIRYRDHRHSLTAFLGALDRASDRIIKNAGAMLQKDGFREPCKLFEIV